MDLVVIFELLQKLPGFGLLLLGKVGIILRNVALLAGDNFPAVLR